MLTLPFDKQIETVAESTAKINIYEGAVRSGKTVAQSLALADMLVSAPRGHILLVAHTLSKVHSNIIANLRELLGAGMVPFFNTKATDITILGRQCKCLGAHSVRALEAARGANIGGIIIDEATTISEDFFMMLCSRLEKTGSKIVATCNPDSSFHYLKRNYINLGDDACTKSFKFTIDCNPHLTETYKDMLRRTLHGVFYKRLYLGEWAIAEGLVYNFIDDKHFFDPPSMAAKYVCGIDFGMRHKTAAILVGLNHTADPAIWVEDEFVWQNTGESAIGFGADIALSISSWLGDRFPHMVYVDPSALMFKEELRRVMPFLTIVDADNDVLNGIACVASLLGAREVKIANKCKELQKELHSYAWDESASRRVGVDKVRKENDDLCDALRYALYSHVGRQTLEQLRPSPTTPHNIRIGATAPYKRTWRQVW